MQPNEFINMAKVLQLITCNWYKICLISFGRLIVKMNLWKEKKSIQVILQIASSAFSFICFKVSPKHILTNSSNINLYQGVMCRVLHMARCTNVATFEILPLHSGVVRGL
jgi:hypothetical protein